MLFRSENYKKFPSNSHQTFEDIINYCFENLSKSIANEVYYQNSDESIAETLEVNEYDFLENGEQFLTK